MFQLVGVVSKKVYYEAKNTADINKWRMSNYVTDKHNTGGASSSYDVPEAMRIVEINAHKSYKSDLQDLLDNGKYEEYRRELFSKSDRDVLVYGGGRDNQKIIERRKSVERLFRQGYSIPEIMAEINMARTTVNTDLRALRKIFPELRLKGVRINES